MDTLNIEHLRKKFNTTWAVKNLNLRLHPGEIFVLLGPNGAGKTTTLKMIAGLVQPTGGKIYIKNLDIHKEPVKAKSLLNYVPDEPFIYNKLTGREFINFTAGIRNIRKDDFQKQVEGLFDKFSIGPWIDDYSESYSHGMKQKVIMCQLFLFNSDLILIDEPLVGLDPKTSKIVREMFFQLRDDKKTLLICTHTLSFAKEIASRIGIINYGALRFTGTLKQLAEIAGDDNIEEIYLRLSEQMPST